MESEVCLCIHGHFYQPPRENPWIEDIERQDSAYPFHNWNERIFRECYQPNSKARILGGDGHIVDIANNYEKISFNFGPTLLSWLELKHPRTYQLILEADRVSCQAHRGHGNAIAQVYNHMIMPLANQRDKITQVRWGIEEFRYRFKRDPESIWLPETGCNEQTLEVLVDHGMKFLILSPYQAERFRTIGSGEWTDVSGGQIDPKRPYRCFLKNQPDRFIDIFFYDGPISRAVSFDNVLFEAKLFMQRLESARVKNGDPSQLISIATDGESYGHHKAFGDRVLAYVTNIEVLRKGYRITNFGEYLELYPPAFEVKLKEGTEGEGTAWSCAHGVSRWKDNCGCRGDGPPEWTQHWRKPLREALDWLRDELVHIYEEQGGRHLKDVWAARDRYVNVVLDRSEENIKRFFLDHASHELTREEIIFCLKLLEMQRHAMLMYTSCGWFFTELSGIETVQIIQYAARAIQLASEIVGISIEEEFLRRLELAPSNVPYFKNGRGVYEKLVRPSVATLSHVVSYYAFGSVFNQNQPKDGLLNLNCFSLKVFHSRREEFGSMTVNFGRVRLTSRITLEEKDLIYCVVQVGAFDFRCSVKSFTDLAGFELLEKDLFDELHQMHIVEFLRKMDLHFGESYFALKDLLREDRVKIIDLLTHESIEKVSSFFDQVYEENKRISEIYRSVNLPIPPEFRYVAEHTLSKRLLQELRSLESKGFNPRKATSIYRIIETAASFDVTLRKDEVRQYLDTELQARIENFVNSFNTSLLVECLNMIKLAKKIEIELDQRKVQDDLFFFVKKWLGKSDRVPEEVLAGQHHLVQLFKEFNLSQEGLKNILK